MEATGGGAFEPSNAVAAVGGPYGSAPARWADAHIRAPHPHGAFAALLSHPDVGLASGWDEVLGR